MAQRLVVDGQPASFADLARAAEVSVPTLRHYFGDRQGAVLAALEAAHEDSEELLEALSEPGPHALRASLHLWATRVIDGFRLYGGGDLFAGGLAQGLHDRDVGPAFVQHMLEPSLSVAERLLTRHRDRGELALTDEQIRGAALSLLAPLVLAWLHQDPLNGQTGFPLDIRSFAASHVDRFLDGCPSGTADNH